MNTRPLNNKIPDIKAVRSLTRLLGKLYLPSYYCRYKELEYEYLEDGTLIGTTEVTTEAYGFGLKEAKDFVERWFKYSKDHKLDSLPWMPYPRS